MGLVPSETLPNCLGLDVSELSQDPGVGFLEFHEEPLSVGNEMQSVSICHLGEAGGNVSPHHGRLKRVTLTLIVILSQISAVSKLVCLLVLNCFLISVVMLCSLVSYGCAINYPTSSFLK